MITSAPTTGWVAAKRDSTASAGGQSEQPSDVNNSTITGRLDFALIEFTGETPP